MIINHAISNNYLSSKKELINTLHNFNNIGENYGNQNRNSLKIYDLNGATINIKSFKIPNLINRVAYRFLRKSKAQRSFEYANKLLDLKIGTPQPIAYFEFQSSLLFGKSYYISEHLNYDLTYRELTIDLNYPDHENILRNFTRFTFELHEKGVHFLDHSPGNTLIVKNKNGNYDFFLVDLNRMEFKSLDFETRMKNFARLTKEKSIIKVMANEYAKLYNQEENLIFEKMNFYTSHFQNQFVKKRALKKKIFFWKK